MKDTACHTPSFWDIYKAINLKKTKNFPCSWCGESLTVKWKKQQKTFIARLCRWVVWMSPAILLMLLVATDMIWYIHAIILITLFHFLAMYFLINSPRLVVKNIKLKTKKSQTTWKKTSKWVVKKTIKKVTKKKK